MAKFSLWMFVASYPRSLGRLSANEETLTTVFKTAKCFPFSKSTFKSDEREAREGDREKIVLRSLAKCPSSYSFGLGFISVAWPFRLCYPASAVRSMIGISWARFGASYCQLVLVSAGPIFVHVLLVSLPQLSLLPELSKNCAFKIRGSTLYTIYYARLRVNILNGNIGIDGMTNLFYVIPIFL